jgi:alcohol dehydrogenase class IV
VALVALACIAAGCSEKQRTSPTHPTASARAQAKSLATRACDGFFAAGPHSTAQERGEADQGYANALVQPEVLAQQATRLDASWADLAGGLGSLRSQAEVGGDNAVLADAAEQVQGACGKAK